jgi:hypothetical protein
VLDASSAGCVWRGGFTPLSKRFGASKPCPNLQLPPTLMGLRFLRTLSRASSGPFRLLGRLFSPSARSLAAPNRVPQRSRSLPDRAADASVTLSKSHALNGPRLAYGKSSNDGAVAVVYGMKRVALTQLCTEWHTSNCKEAHARAGVRF